MCYDISYLTKRQIDYANRYGTVQDVEDLMKKLPAAYHVNAFQMAGLPVLVGKERRLDVFEWGLIPFWAKTAEEAVEIRKSTFNARGETLFEKPSFRKAAQSGRCLVLVDGFYESHHFKGRTYPYYISRKDGRPFTLGAVYDEWTDAQNGEIKQTLSIVTTAANERMAVIHNNPKVLERGGPRMPLILPYEWEDKWLDTQLSKEETRELIHAYPSKELIDHTVRPLRGKSAAGNTPAAMEPFRYPDLGAEQTTLF